MSSHWLKNIEYLSDFSLRNKESSILEVENLHNIYYKAIINIMKNQDQPILQNNIVDISDYQADSISSVASSEYWEWKLIQFPVKKINVISLYYEIFDVQNRIYRLIRDFKREATKEVFKRKYMRNDWVWVMEFVDMKYRALKSSYFDRSKEEDIHDDIIGDYMALKDKIWQERKTFNTELIDTFYLDTKERINNNTSIWNKKKLTDSLEKCFVSLSAEFIKLSILEDIKWQNITGKKIVIGEFKPVLENINDLQVYIDENLENKNSYFYKDFQLIYILMKRLFFS